MRAALVLAAGQFGKPDPVRLVRLGALVELLHLASLLHDDVVDRAPLRRGAPTAYSAVGADRATLAGLACFALAGMEAASIGGGADVLAGRAMAGLAYGELLDVERAFDVSLSIPDYLELAERKTGDLFRLSCLLGAAEAGVPPETGQALGTFGAQAGVAFQILDDCLDLDAEGPGKLAGTDHMLGLFGAPALYALRADTSGELAAMLLSPSFGRHDLPAMREIVVASGGLAAGIALARQCYERALASLAGLAEGPSQALAEVFAQMWQDLT